MASHKILFVLLTFSTNMSLKYWYLIMVSHSSPFIIFLPLYWIRLLKDSTTCFLLTKYTALLCYLVSAQNMFFPVRIHQPTISTCKYLLGVAKINPRRIQLTFKSHTQRLVPKGTYGFWQLGRFCPKRDLPILSVKFCPVKCHTITDSNHLYKNNPESNKKKTRLSFNMFNFISARHPHKKRTATCKHTAILDILCSWTGAIRSVSTHDLRLVPGYPGPVLPGGSAGASLRYCVEGCTAGFTVFAQTIVYT